MHSVFDPKFQNNDISSKIVFALERLSQVFRSNLWQENKKYNLSPLQIQILLFLKYQTIERGTVSYLAQEFNMTKATISDAVKTLEQKGLVTKLQNPDDGRSYLLRLTEAGQQTGLKLSTFANQMRQYVENIPDDKKEVVLTTLFELIFSLQQNDHISPQRICFSCRYFERATAPEAPYFCQLLQLPMQENDLRINCLEHEEK